MKLMRYLLLMIFCSGFGIPVLAQDSVANKPKKVRFYVATALGYASKGPLYGGAINVLLPSEFGLYFRAFSNTFESKQLPKDYDSGLDFFGGKNPNPSDVINVYSIGGIKEIIVTKRSYLYKAGLELGPCIYVNKAGNFTRANAGSGWFGSPSNYDMASTTTSVAALLIRPKLKMLDNQNWGLELASSIVISRSAPFYGIELNVTSGSFKATKKRASAK